MTLTITLCCIVCYLIGAFPTGILISRYFGGNITEAGNGNIGMTNITRTLGPNTGAIALFFDILKGMLSIYVYKFFVEFGLNANPSEVLLYSTSGTLAEIFSYGIIGGIFAVLGSCFSIPFLGIKSGKGVATAFGVLAGFEPLLAGLGGGLFGLVYYWTQIISLSSLVACIGVMLFVSALCFLIPEGAPSFIPIIVLCGIIFLRHRDSIDRLMKGEEEKFILPYFANKSTNAPEQSV